MSDVNLARRVLEEAKRLNMVDGHFVWLWIDTAAQKTTNKSSNQFPNHQSPTLDSSDPQQKLPHHSTVISSNPIKKQSKKFKRQASDKFNVPTSNDNIVYFNETIESFKKVTIVDNNLFLENPPIKYLYKHEDMWPTINTPHRKKRDVAPKTVKNLREDAANIQNINYLLKNDKSLLIGDIYSNSYGGSAGKNTNSDYYYSDDINSEQVNSDNKDSDNDNNNSASGLPIGLLAIKIQPLRLDRHLVKGAVRLLAVTLRNVLAQSSPEDWVSSSLDKSGKFIDKTMYASCWHSSHIPNKSKDRRKWDSGAQTSSQSFSSIFAR